MSADPTTIAADFGHLLVAKFGTRPFFAFTLIVLGSVISIFGLARESEWLSGVALAIGTLMILVGLWPAARFLYGRD